MSKTKQNDKNESTGFSHIFDNSIDIADKKSLENRLELLASAIHHSGEAFYIVDPSKDFQFIFANSAACKMTGYTEEELLKMRSLDLNANAVQEDLNEIEDSLIKDKNFYFETKHRLKDGSILDVEINAYEIIFEGEPLHIAFVRDITERKVQEELLRKKEFEFHSLAENIPDNIARWDKMGNYLYLNPTHERTLGNSLSKAVGKNIPAKFTKVKEAIEKVVTTKQKFIVHQEVPNENGEIEIHDVSLVPEFDAEGELISVLGVGRDMTDTYRLQDTIFAREKEFRTLVENLPDNIIRYNTACQAIYVSPRMERVYGHDAVAMIMGKTPNERAMHGYIPENYQQTMEQALASGEKAEIDIEVSSLSGDKQYHHIRFVPERDKNGEICSVLAIGHNITERKMIEKKMEYMAHHDILTDLPNRVIAKIKTEEAIAFASNNNSKAVLFFLDLDGFKTINDSLGHSIGDEMLKKVAARLKECKREDITICRHGGDEFLIILPMIKDMKDVLAIMEKLLSKFKEPFSVGNHLLSTSASIGVAIYPDSSDSFESLLKNADTAMYEAKANGKNTYSVYDTQMSEKLMREFRIQNDLKSAIENNEFVLYYQPQIDLKLNRITGAEALIRWKHPVLGIIPPIDFISIAESTGLIVQIGEWVVMEACRQASLLAKKGMGITIAVNVSAVQFKRGDFVAVVKKALSSSGIDPKYLELELTESIMVHDTEIILQSVQTLKALGIQLSIDDFGTGYSSLSYLKRFAVDKLKIDQSFVRDILWDKDDKAIVRTIIQMAKNLNLRTIAEGVEDEHVLNVIDSLGCDEVQGYYFAKPMEAIEFEKYYSSAVLL
ncbi:EAL domain-containing protein [bacterium]|nr:EAL domain-containing protein [bacterium]MBU1433364.1 EAL domain-containing protein [bacterium]MBU1503440.1 EAL domain-containing protein [bacterium]